MLTPADAARLIAEHAPRLPVAPVALRDAAGCILRQQVHAERDQPPFDRVAMDGIAVASKATSREFRIAGTQAAGAPPLTLAQPSDCIEAMTGAMLPIGCDCVIPVERITIRDSRATLAPDVELAPWLNIHRRGVDIKGGALTLHPGVELGAPEVAVLASSGLLHVQVTRAPRIVVISTGDELVEPGQPIEAWQIRRSNVFGVLAALRRHGFARTADDHVPDDIDSLRKRLSQHLDAADVLILSGGVSMGKFDFIPQVLTELGVQQIFHKIAQRPGKPMWFGVRRSNQGADKAVYALPGNPVSTLACMARYVLPALKLSMGLEPHPVTTVQLTATCKTLPTLATLLPVRLAANGGAQPQPTQGSGDFTALIGAHGCVELPAGTEPVLPGSVVKFFAW